MRSTGKRLHCEQNLAVLEASSQCMEIQTQKHRKKVKKMRFPREKWFFARMLSTIVLLTMATSAFCETLNLPSEYSAIEDAIYAHQQGIYATNQEGTPPPYCYECHVNIVPAHHGWIPNPPEYPGDPSSPYNPCCPDPPLLPQSGIVPPVILTTMTSARKG
jgi:hypothetical protein